jgi:hypothetical protein
MTRASRPVACATAALVVVLSLPTLAAGKRKPPPPPPDSAADCTFFVEPSIDDYIVLATLAVGVRCATTKQRITVTASSFTRDGATVPLLPYDTLTCTNTSSCAIGIDLFSYDNHPVAFPGDQRYCATGFGVVGGQVVGPRSGCEEDPRI